MKAYLFRFLNDDNEPTEYQGIVVANTRKDLFWAIDEHGDPYRCEIKPISQGSVCFKYEDYELLLTEDAESNYSDPDPSEDIQLALDDEDGWHRAFTERYKAV